jgi:two-component system, OmpR family, manganese sensing sensor histidine kinase
MTRLTEDLLFLARTDNLPNRQRQVVNLKDSLDELVQLYQLQAVKKSIALQMNDCGPLYLLGDLGQLKRLFTNLIVNALQYTSEGGRVEIERHRIGSQIVISVKDTGIGMTSEQQNRVFDRFWRADQSRSYESGSSGLGLAIAQAIIQAHGGWIEVDSHVGVGSCFTIRLPAAAK